MIHCCLWHAAAVSLSLSIYWPAALIDRPGIYRLSATLPVTFVFVISQVWMKQENDRKSREEMTLGNIPSRGEWLLGREPVRLFCSSS